MGDYYFDRFLDIVVALVLLIIAVTILVALGSMVWLFVQYSQGVIS